MTTIHVGLVADPAAPTDIARRMRDLVVRRAVPRLKSEPPRARTNLGCVGYLEQHVGVAGLVQRTPAAQISAGQFGTNGCRRRIGTQPLVLVRITTPGLIAQSSFHGRSKLRHRPATRTGLLNRPRIAPLGRPGDNHCALGLSPAPRTAQLNSPRRAHRSDPVADIACTSDSYPGRCSNNRVEPAHRHTVRVSA